ncbi:MAG: LCP family protein [Ilumatobacteraceae bacterium]
MSDTPEPPDWSLTPPPAPTPTRPDDSPSAAKKVRRTWPQRLIILATFVFAAGSFGAAGALYAGQRVVEDRNLAPEIIDPALATTTTIAGVNADDDEAIAPEDTAPPGTFPEAEPEARNFLITGADNNSCVDADSAYAPAFGDRTNFGERSDTIMMWRVNPATSEVVVLSFPRDLFVSIAGSSRQGRINEAYERDNPQKLIDTIYQNFGINTDHFVQVDFCAFKTLVDAVDGVAVPFDTLIQDPNTGLNVTETGCFTFDGDHALAYVRSRKLQYLDTDGDWTQDPTSDLGRISRQQDFLRRTVARLLSKGAFDPNVAGGLIETITEYIVSDDELTPRKMLEFAGVLSKVDPIQIKTYQVNAVPKTIQGNAVLEPAIKGANMQAVLAVFRGEATLTDAPDLALDTTTVAPDPATPATTAAGSAPSDTTVTGTTLPLVEADQNVYGIVPDPNNSC